MAVESIAGVPVVHWNPRRPILKGRVGRLVPIRRPVNNFGDLLGPLVVRLVLESRSVHTSQSSGTERLVTVGSIMHHVSAGDTVWGTGVNGKHLDKVATMPRQISVRAVRGPRTRAALAEAGIDAPPIYGDPAQLLPHFYPAPTPTAASGTGALWVPNFHEIDNPIQQPVRSLDPRLPIDTCISQIVSAEFVAASSLHGIIVAEAYGVPARLVKPEHEPDFKYLDYYEATGRPDFRAARSLDEALHLGPETAPTWNADPLLAAFPVDLWTRPHLDSDPSVTTSPRL